MDSLSLNDLLQIIGKQLQDYRNSKNEKQITVAHATGISVPVLSKIECGRYRQLTVEKLLRLTSYYHITIDKIIGA